MNHVFNRLAWTSSPKSCADCTLVLLSTIYHGPISGVWIWPLLGLFLLPTTTLAYCWAIALDGGFSSFSGLLILAMGILFDIGFLGGGRGVLRR